MARTIKRLYVHTAAAGKDKPIDQSAKTIKDYHINVRKFKDIGYHKVIRFNGDIEVGRSESMIGAGVSGDNSNSLHVCCTGHGDLADFTAKQKVSLVNLLVSWLKTYKLEDEFLAGRNVILGHAEYWKYVKPGRALKSCPGNKVDMDEIRSMVKAKLSPEPKKLTIIVNGVEAEGYLENGEVFVNISKLAKTKSFNKDTKTSTYTI